MFVVWSLASSPDGSPVLKPLMVNGQTVGMAFQHPEWRHLPRKEFDRLIGGRWEARVRG
jgi:hypothetical protein